MSTTPPPPDGTHPEDEAPATRSALDDRWWWSAVLWMVVGVGVIAYQSGPIRTGTAIGLTWVLVAIGALVAARGALMLWRAWRAQQAAGAEPDGNGPV
ncbi:hypothetical protein [Actinotalea sp.]|uniref:hypothetical protein n=1 Tax=Actinotalea sp. TaxID=1872145 RepID=UPI0035698E39